jgi:phospholipase D1/2
MSFFKNKLQELKDLPKPEGSGPMGFFTDAIKKTAKVVEHGRQEVIGEQSGILNTKTQH